MLAGLVVRGVLLPAVVSAAVLALVLGRRGGPSRPWAAWLAVGIGYAVGHAAVVGWPPFPPIEATQWLPYLALATALVTGGGIRRDGEPVGEGVRRTLFAFGPPALLLSPLVRHAWTGLRGAVWVAVSGSALLLLLGGLEALARTHDRARLPPCVLTAAVGSLTLLVSGSALLAQLGGVLAACLAAVAVAAWIRPGCGAGGFAFPFSVLLGGLVLAGHHYAELPASSALLLAASAPLALWLQRGALRRGSVSRAALAGSLVALGLAGAGLVLAWRAGPSF